MSNPISSSARASHALTDSPPSSPSWLTRIGRSDMGSPRCLAVNTRPLAGTDPAIRGPLHHRILPIIVIAITLLGIAGCGKSEVPSANQLERDLANAVRDNNQGTLTQVECVSESDRKFKCVGNYRPSLGSVRDQGGGFIDEQSVRQIQEAQTGQRTFDVTVADDGRFVYE